jgi:hypothetical protein
MATCPFCMTPVHDDATVCPGCGARKGHCQSNGQVQGLGACMLGLILSIVFVIAMFLINGYLGWFVLLIFGAVFLSEGFPNAKPHWYR